MRTIRSIVELDQIIEECNRAEAISDDALRAVFPTFRMDVPEALPVDPFSAEYRQFQLSLYSSISGRAYSTANEVIPLDVETAVLRPFPYYTGSGVTAGEHLVAIGLLLRTMALPKGSRILELGPGWGNTSIILGQLGHDVTVVDVGPYFCDLIYRRAAREQVDIEIVNADFFWVEQTEKRFDAVIFFECFHHCADPIRLLRAIDRVVTPGGKIFFAAEPIVADFPMPWGLRLDGNSLWAIRKNGWLELGFREDFFRDALQRCGWIGEKIRFHDLEWSTIWKVGRRREAGFRLSASAPEIKTEIGLRRPDGIEFTGRPGMGVYGPYLPLPRGKYVARLEFDPEHPPIGTAEIDVCTENGTVRIASRRIAFSGPTAGRLSPAIAFEAIDDLTAVEARLFCENGFIGKLKSVEVCSAEK